MPPDLRQARRVLVVRLDNIGDVVMLDPMLRALRGALPAAHVTLLCSPAGAQAAQLLRPWIDEVLVRRAVWQDATDALPLDPGRELALIADLRALHADAALICTSFSQSAYPAAYACYLAGIPLRAGQSSEFGGGLLTHAVTPLPDGAHQVDRNLHLLRTLGIPAEDRALRVAIPADASASVQPLLPARPFVAIAPAASCSARTYDRTRFAEAAETLSRRGYGIVLLGSARDVPACDAIAQAIPGARSLAGATTIPQLAAVIAEAALLLGCHSGPMHLADAVGTPAVIAFAGTDRESEWMPRGIPAALLRRATPCAPCRAFTCDRDLACLDISADAVVDAALALLDHRVVAAVQR